MSSWSIGLKTLKLDVQTNLGSPNPKTRRRVLFILVFFVFVECCVFFLGFEVQKKQMGLAWIFIKVGKGGRWDGGVWGVVGLARYGCGAKGWH